MAKKVQAGAALLILLLATSGARAACSTSDLTWLVGKWHYSDSGTVVEESWTATPADQLIRLAWTTVSGQLGVIKISSIVSEKGQLVFRGRGFDGSLAHFTADGAAPITQTVKTCGTNSVAFEGIGQSAGERIAYKRDGDTLSVTGDVTPSGHFYRKFKRE